MSGCLRSQSTSEKPSPSGSPRSRMRRSGRLIRQSSMADCRVLGVVDADIRLFEAGNDYGGKVDIVLYQQNVCRAGSGVENAREFGQEKVFVEGLLDPALSRKPRRWLERIIVRRKDREDHHWDVGCRGGVLGAMQGLPAVHAGHVKVEEDGFDGASVASAMACSPLLGFKDVISVLPELSPTTVRMPGSSSQTTMVPTPGRGSMLRVLAE